MPLDATTEPGWLDFHQDARPSVVRGLYWFRIPGRVLPGTACTVEWVEELAACGMGYGPREPWPGFSHWDGWNRTVPKGTQWRPITDGVDTAKSERYPGLDLCGCPFCGTLPVVEWAHRDLRYGGGIYVGSRPYQANVFRLECRGCWFARTPDWTDLGKLVERWNRRDGSAMMAA